MQRKKEEEKKKEEYKKYLEVIKTLKEQRELALLQAGKIFFQIMAQTNNYFAIIIEFKSKF